MNRYDPSELVHFDFESRSPVPIRLGAYRYAVEAEPILLSYTIGDGPVQLVDRRGAALTWADIPADLRKACKAGKVFCAWNTGFDRAIWNYAMAGSPFLAPAQVIDARATALAHNLPDDLETASVRLGGPGKQKDGKKLIARFCGSQAVKADAAPQEWDRFCSYARQDVAELRRVFRLMVPALTGYDWATYQANEVINDTGIGVDLDFCREAARLAAEESVRIGHRLAKLTDGAITSISQNLRLAHWMHNRLPSVEARAIMSTVFKEEADSEDDDALVETVKLTIARGTVERLLDLLRAEQCDDRVLMEVLELREFGASAAPKKFQAILDRHIDGRLRGEFVFNGAGQTGRFSGKGTQLQNLTRVVLGKDASDDYGYWEESTVALITSGCSLAELAAHGAGEVPARKLALTIRPAFIAKGSRTLVKADYAQVEARVLPWLSKSAGGDKLLDAFRLSDSDPDAPDLYEVTAAGMTKKQANDISKEERQRGKVAVLACFAADTRVLTDHGIKHIINVSLTDKLWDGKKWVTHQGLISQGLRSTIELDGVSLTPEHLVETNRTWKPAELLVSNAKLLHQALATGSASLQSLGISTRRQVAAPTSMRSALAGLSHIASRFTISARVLRHDALLALQNRLATGSRVSLATLTSFLMMRTVVAYSTVFRLALPVVTLPTIHSTLTTVNAASTSSVPGEVALKEDVRFSRIWSRLKVGISRSLRSTGLMLTKVMNPEIFVLPRVVKTWRTDDQSRRCNDASRNLKPVYDIAHAGPRNRFTILTNSGALVVHNCGYGGGRNALHSMAANYRMHFADAEAQSIVDAWRAANPWAPAFWGKHAGRYVDENGEHYAESYGLFGAARRAIEQPKTPVAAGRLTFVYVPTRRDGMLMMILPSGRPLIYPSCKMRDYDVVDKRTKQVIDTRHGLTFRRARGVIALYGGRLAENCLAEGTLVLTRRGWLRIEKVTTTDTVWDGLEWVRHDGLIEQGEQPCMAFNGVLMTPDHKVLTDEGWCTAQSNPRPARQGLWLPDGAALRGRERSAERQPTEMPLRLRGDSGARRTEPEPYGAGRLHAILSCLQISTQWRKPANAWHVEASGVHGVVLDASPLSRSQPSRLEELWRTWNHGLQTLGKFIQEFLVGHGADVAKRTGAGPQEQRKELRAKQLSLGYPHREHEQQTRHTPSEHARVGETTQSAGRHTVHSLISRNVYDLRNAGPRSRFVVLGADGPFVVSNCTQAVAADLLREAIVRLVTEGHMVVSHSHDEIVVECERRDVVKTEAALRDAMLFDRPWAKGLPLAVETSVKWYYSAARIDPAQIEEAA